MDQKIQEILNELYLMDPDLKQHEDELKEIIQEMLVAKPDTKFSPEFAESLKQKLHSTITAAKAETKTEHGSWFSNFFKTPWVGALGLAIVVLIALGVWKGFFSGPTIPAQFTLKANISDKAGVAQNTTFTLKSNQPLSANEVKKIVKFEPAIDFDVNKIASQTALVQEVLAENSEAKSYAYELKPKDPLQGEQVYQASINDKQYADRDYGWAFQVKSGFQVIKTHPGDKTGYVPINTGIEMTFNRTNIKNIDKYFQIEPNVAGRFEVYDDTAVFLPKNQLAQHTVYKVTLKKGLMAEGSEDTLANDYSFSFETYADQYQPSSYLSFAQDFGEVLPGSKADLSMYSYNVDNSKLDAKVYQVNNPDEFITSYQNSRVWDWNWTSYYKQNSPTAFSPNGKQPVMSFKPEVITHDYQSYIELPEVLNQGMYVVDIAYGDKHEQMWIEVTPVAHYFAISHDTSLLWLYNFKDKTPVKNAQVEFYQSGSSSQNLGTSNGDGLNQFNTPDPLKSENSAHNSNPSFFKVKDDGGNITWVKIQDSWGYSGAGVNAGNNYWKFLSTDRYTYQMTDTAKFWGVVKSRKEDVRQKKVKVAIYDTARLWDYSKPLAQQQSVASEEVMISPFNTIEGQLSFKGLDPKTYDLVVTLGDEEVGRGTIEVLTYTKPSYQLSVTTSKAAIFAGDPVTFTVKGTFFDGTPLSDTEVKYSGYWNNQIEGTVKLDANGQASVTLTPEYIDQPNSYPRSLGLTFTPATAEEGEISGSGNVLVFGPHMYLQGFQDKQQGDNYTFRAKLNTIDITNQVPDDNGYMRTEYIAGPIQNYPVKATITKTTYTQVETGDYYDPINKTVNKTYNYVRNDSVFDTISGTTNNNGEFIFTKNLPKQDYTYYSIEFSVTDQQGRTITAGAYAYYASYDYWQPSGLSLNINNESYQKEFSVGDQVSLNVQASNDLNPTDKPILYYRWQNSITKAVIQKDTHYAEAFGNDFLPSVQYKAVTLGAYGFAESNSVFANFKKDDNNIKISISTDKDNYRPGDKVAIKLHVTDKNGNPLSAETNIAIVDEAVFHVLPYNWQQQILDSLYQPIYNSPLTGSTSYLLPQSGGGGGGAEKGGCFVAGTKILLANGKTKNIEDIRTGDQILTFNDEFGRKMVRATVQGYSSHEVDEYLIINGSLAVTQEHKIFLNGEWNFAGNAKVGDTLTLTNGDHQIIRSVVHKPAPHTMVYNIVVGQYHTYFADGYFVHNAEKGGTSTRDNFVDTASFQTVHTNSSGDAHMEFTAPDNITSWRVTARSFEANSLKAGEETKLVPTTLPLFVNAVLNETYLVGDSPQLKIGVYGTQYKADQDSQVTVTSGGLKLNQNVAVKNHLGYITLNNLPEGDYDIVISAKQGGNQDALKKKISVVKSYFVKPTIDTKPVQNGLLQIAGNSNGYTTIEFMDAGKGKFYQQLLSTSYSGGLRVDQIAPGYYATKILNDSFNYQQPQDKLDLSTYQNTQGEASANGIRLFPYSDVDLELSAKIADLAATDLSTQSLNDYFAASLHDQKADIHRQAAALYGLASIHKPVLTRLQDIRDVKELNLQDRIYVALGLAKLGDTEEARAMYYQDIRPHLHVDGPQAWVDEEQDQTKRSKLTDTLGLVASYTGVEDDAQKVWAYMENHYPVKDLDSIERVLFIRSEIAHANNAEAKFSYQAGSKSETVDLKNGQTKTVLLSSDELKNLTFSNLSGSVQAISHYEQGQDPNSLAKDSKLSISRQYTVNGKVTTDFNETDIVRVKIYPKIEKSALDGDYQVIDYLPSGFKPITDPYTLGIDQGYNCISYPQKIVNNKLYFTIYKDSYIYNNCDAPVQYYARVVSKGTYTANPTLLQSSLNEDDLNISESTKVNVK